jgi:hypothetical protein
MLRCTVAPDWLNGFRTDKIPDFAWMTSSGILHALLIDCASSAPSQTGQLLTGTPRDSEAESTQVVILRPLTRFLRRNEAQEAAFRDLPI